MMTIKQCREFYGISKEEIAKETGISTATIAKWEQGKQSPTAAQACKVLEFFNSKGLNVGLDSIDFAVERQTA